MVGCPVGGGFPLAGLAGQGALFGAASMGDGGVIGWW